MLSAFAENQDHIGEDQILAAVDELQWSDYKSRTNRLSVLRPRKKTSFTEGVPIAKLMVAHPDEESVEFPIIQGRLILGRTEDNDLQIDSKFVSRHHAQILTYNKDSILQDLNSTNGIYMKGKRVKKRRLRDGDLFVIGEHELLYVRESDAVASEETEAAKAGAE